LTNTNFTSIELPFSLIYSSVKNIPSGWDSLATNNLFLSRDYLELLTMSAQKYTVSFWTYFSFNDKLVGAVSQYINLKVNSFGERDHCAMFNFVFKTSNKTCTL
jgi:hypothetical protein